MKQPRDSDSDAFDVGIDEDTVEFELSAQDLLELSRSGAIQGPTPMTVRLEAGLPGERPISSQVQTARKNGEAPSRDDRVGLYVSIVVAVVVTGAVPYLYSRSEGAVRSVTAIAPQAAAPLAQSSPTPASEQVPVRFANPFDHTEVFEFPPGTSEATAREAVVEVLMNRAQDRKHQRNARSVAKKKGAALVHG